MAQELLQPAQQITRDPLVEEKLHRRAKNARITLS